MGTPVTEFQASWVGRPAARAAEGELPLGLGLAVALVALVLTVTPSVIGLLVLMGRLT